MKEILIVDNKQRSRETLNMHLECAGFKTEEAGDVVDAFVALDDNPRLDIIILDLSLPEHDGYWMLEMLQECMPYAVGRYSVIVIGNCTIAAFYEELEMRGIDASVVLEFFEKPVYYYGIVWEIESLLERTLMWR